MTDPGAAWYFWKRPDPHLYSRLSAWLSYALHQLAIWWLIYSAQRDGALDNQSWQMFAFGFGTIFLVTQMHGLVDALRIPLIYVFCVPILALLLRWMTRAA